MKDIKSLYKKRKNFILPTILFLASSAVIFVIVIPQWNDLKESGSLIEKKKEIVTIREYNLNFLRSLENSEVEDDYSIVTTALPDKKDIVLIFSQLQSISSEANVKLGGYSLKVGDVYQAAGQEKPKVVDGIPYLNILVNAKGGDDEVRRFAQLMNDGIPLTEIKSIDIVKGDAKYDINFFFMPSQVLKNKKEDEKISELTTSDKKELEKLRMAL